jgi:hypothetical protein
LDQSFTTVTVTTASYKVPGFRIISSPITTNSYKITYYDDSSPLVPATFDSNTQTYNFTGLTLAGIYYYRMKGKVTGVIDPVSVTFKVTITDATAKNV